MAQPKKVSVDQVLKLVEQLTPSERGELRNKLDTTWGERWDSLVARVEERNKGLPPLTEEEIYAEFTEHRREQRAMSAQSGD
jgi:hypothetical protein